MKNIFTSSKTAFITLTCLLALAGCSKQESSPVAGGTPSFSKPTETDVVNGFASISGLMYNRRAGNNVPITNDSARLVISFGVTMSANYSVTLKKVMDNSTVPVTCSWDIGNGYSTLTIYPTASLDVSKRYWIKVAGASLADAYGNRFDYDGDNIGGEAVDDDFEFYFTTYDVAGAPSTPTDAQNYVVDRQPPVITGGAFCWISGALVAPAGIYVDAPLYLRLTDVKLLADRSNYDIASAYLGTIDDSRIWLVNAETQLKIPSQVTFGNDPNSGWTPTGSTVRIQPNANLEPGKTYYVVVKQNAIVDADGNKMSQFDGHGQDTALFAITTGDSLVGGGAVRTDIIVPSFVFSAPNKTLTFTERIDESTLNSSTIWYQNGTVQYPFVLAIVTEYTALGAPITVVHLTPVAGHASGTISVNMRQIKDLNGNYGAGIITNSF
ncbi:MAG: Ig-like domain-containing protein [Fibrobacterota bacterium]